MKGRRPFRSYPSAATRANSSPYSGALPSWLASATGWAEAPGGSYLASSAYWTGTSPGGAGPATELINAWADMVINTKGVYIGSVFVPGIFFIFHNGGHGNWGGNELVAYGPVNSENPGWYMLRNPTVPGPSNVGEDGLGNPGPTHTYRSLAYIGHGSNNGMLRIGADALYPDAGGSSMVHYFDFNVPSPNTNQPWSRKADCIGPADVCAINPINNTIWSHSNNLSGNANNVQFYDFDGNLFSSATSKNPSFGSFTASSAIDESRNIWAIIGDTGLNFLTIQASFAGFTADYTVPSVGGTAPNSGGRKGLLRDPINDRFVSWDDGGKKLWFLKNTGPWDWTSRIPSGGVTPAAADSRGIYGRFAYFTMAGVPCYALVPSASSSVFIYPALN